MRQQGAGDINKAWTCLNVRDSKVLLRLSERFRVGDTNGYSRRVKNRAEAALPVRRGSRRRPRLRAIQANTRKIKRLREELRTAFSGLAIGEVVSRRLDAVSTTQSGLPEADHSKGVP